MMTTAEVLRRDIERRHQQDDHLFSGGLHDPNGYAAMAHKDRGVLLDMLARQTTPGPSSSTTFQKEIAS